MKKKTKRSSTKYPALNKSLNLKIRSELIDFDYVDKLSEEEKAWLNKFSEEYTNASFKKNKDGSFSRKNLHKGSLRNDCYNRNNWRNNDVYGVSKANDMLKDAKKMNNHLEESSKQIAGLIRG